jgi:hypothetical protein
MKKKMKQYITAKHPKTGKLWIMGYCGDRYYVPIREVRKNAKDEIIHLLKAEQSAKNELKYNL